MLVLRFCLWKTEINVTFGLNINDPNGGSVFNISRETTHRELCKIEGVSEYTRRMCGINLSGGQTNAVEVACGLFKLPTMDILLESFKRELYTEQSDFCQ